MKAYRLKITCFILLLLPVLTCCTDEELLRGSGVPEGVPTTVDISVGTAANRAKTRSGLPEGEERKIYNLYLWVFDSRGGVEFSREYPRAELYQAAAALETATGEKDTDAPTSMGLLKNIPITSGEKTLVLLANYKSDGDGLFQVEPGILAGVSSLSDIQRVKAEMTARTLFRPNGNLLMSVTKTEEISPDTRRLEVSLKRAEAKITVNLKTGDPNRVSIMGFSAGGHLAATAATHFTGPEDRPDFSILIYPVISMDSITHQGSKDNLLGTNAPAELAERYSNEKQVTDQTPRAFIALSDDDNGVPPANSIGYYSALKKHNVPAELHVYPSGGHGWGWRDRFEYHDELRASLGRWLEEIRK